MKLTNYQRDAFVTSVMNDVPQIDYDDQIRSLMSADLRSQLPPVIRALVGTSNEAYLKTSYFYLRNVPLNLPKEDRQNLPSTSICAPSRSDTAVKFSDAAVKAIKPLAIKLVKQQIHRATLKSKLHNVAYSCATRKALVDALPEFVKYMPAETPPASRMLPVVANVVADFVKAGWPKGKKPAARAAA